MAKLLAIQSADKRAKGIGWKAEPCPVPISCEGRTVRSDPGTRLRPVDPLAFAKWRLRSKIGKIPPTRRARHATRRA